MAELDPESEYVKKIKPVVKETYAILLDKRDAFVGEVAEVNEADKLVIINNLSKKEDVLMFLMNDEGELIMNSEKGKYKLLDIERVIPFDLSILESDTEQINKQLTSDIIKGLDISLEEIKQKDIVYTDVEIKEQLLSSLMSSFDGYDNFKITQMIHTIVDQYIQLKTSIKKEIKKLPNWLIPLVDNPLKLYQGDTPDLYEEMLYIKDSTKVSPYYQGVQTILDSHRPIEPSLSEVGFTTTNHVGDYLRDCMQDTTCVSIGGNYKYDKRRNKDNFTLDSTIVNKRDNLNIVGLLYVPDSELIHCLKVDPKETYSLHEKNILQELLNSCSIKLQSLRNKGILQKELNPEFELTDINSLTSYNIHERLSEDVFFEYIRRLTPNIQQMIESVDESISQKLLNYQDLKLLFIKYNLHISTLNKEEKSYLHELITANSMKYMTDSLKLPKININLRKVDLTVDKKISLSKDLIWRMVNIPKRNEYMCVFIKQFTREPSTRENPNNLYNIYTNEPILCKHYLYSSVYHRDRDAFKTMVTIFGSQPEDGVVSCKHCGEYLCQEDFSEFDGFSDEQPIFLREELKVDVDLLKDYKESLVLLVKQISGCLGVNIIDEDIKFILDIYKTFNEDIIANIRYGSSNITDSEEHPIIKAIKKKYKKEKDKKTLIKRDVSKFQSYIKHTNRVLSLTTLCILVIQTRIPKYSLKRNVDMNYIDFENNNLNRIVLDYAIQKLSKISDKEDIWLHFKELLSEHKVFSMITVKEQMINITNYCLSPQFGSIIKRINECKEFIKSEERVYIRDEWTTFKPLRKNKDIEAVDNLLQDKDKEFKPFYILDYNNYPIENVSMIKSIEKSSKEPMFSLLNIPISEIMINKSFLLIFKYCVSNYGVNKSGNQAIYLHFDRFLNTIKKRDEVEAILRKHNWSIQNHPSYKVLRTKIVPEIIKLYQDNKQELEPCFSNSDICNKFIHININNYELFMLTGNSKRIYKHREPLVYPYKEFDEIEDEFKEKIFKRYCKDPTGKIVPRLLLDNYLDKFAIDIAGDIDIQLPDVIREYEYNLDSSKNNFKEILVAIQSNLMKLSLYHKPKYYQYQDYINDIYKQNNLVERRIIQLFKENQYLGLEKDNELLNLLQEYIDSESEPSTLKKQLEQKVSSLDIQPFIDEISYVIYNSEYSSHKKRFESIFINTSDSINLSSENRQELEGEGFRYKNLREQDISKILGMFINDDKLTTKLGLSYINQLNYSLSYLSNDYSISPYIPLHWRLSENNYDLYSRYIQVNSASLHRDIFNKNPVYKGFNEYNEPYIFKALHRFLKPYMNTLFKLQINQYSVITDIMEGFILRHMFMFIISKMIEFYNKVKEDDDEINEYLEMASEGESINKDIVVSVLERFILDTLINILEQHYDSNWITSNTNKDDLTKRLSKQREREKQMLIQKLDSMSDEKRATTVEKQKMGLSSYFKTSAEENSFYVQSEERTEASDLERYNTINELFAKNELQEYAAQVSNGELDDSRVPNPLPRVEEELGYYNENDIDEDGQMGDELHEFNDEDLLDNPFN